MKNINDYIKIENQDGVSGKKESTNFHKITLDSDKEKQLGEKKSSEIRKYFSGLKNKYEEDDKGRYRILIPRDAYDLKVLIDDLNSILNS
ncbi:hypothetical protein UT300003_11070 [Clostridium sardiniense]|uniref:hypothetical protein n=1 Tax=Clostridium sardiniense TaxID=29369 RepID=UPI0019578E29|nr:hypothetical protein [Clostridium sardiniense]MBM7836008.1 hypothetical protein [Clostridium sardiniense]